MNLDIHGDSYYALVHTMMVRRRKTSKDIIEICRLVILVNDSANVTANAKINTWKNYTF